ncbi:serine hydrolase [Actinoplanes sp. NBRC 14428]|uniref:D-alanyl-D-alanine carboxypeptidase n=1 Tax=Pseudosporangium ferrugineum TaxID=439699 RepID=A0A2T0RC20_9ACTN|nr:serine hydrolase domain-containing protein [Pseudosporangium ferrugineum]PRY18712.1 D-alanyl-D-alanine carboxypeptidase [Pseudosporangium ferrugineum]BCJ55499.1 serine hydrolase [Actinoplanes sp. NBRC 14428]
MAQHRTVGTSPGRTPRRRRVTASLATLGGLAAAGILAVPALASAGAAPASGPAGAAPAPALAAAAAHGQHRDALQRSLDGLVADDGFPGVLASVRESNGKTRTYTAGVSDLRTKAKVPENGRVRIASNTKMFTATVVLQLVGEGKIALDEPVETYLPGVVRGEGIDGRRITVRQLLQQTSGLPDYDEVLFKDFVNALDTYYEPDDLLRVAFAAEPESQPGEKFVYSNTNYILAGLVAQKVSGRPIGELITKRIIEPLGLRDTYWPGEGERTIRGPHPRGYFPAVDGKPAIDITRSEPSAGWSAGGLIGTPADLNRFFAGLLGGKLLAPAQLAEMKKTVDAPGFDTVGGSRYGLGLATFKLSCGGFAWTHGGIAPGYVTVDGITASGKVATVAVTSLITTEKAAKDVDAALDTALCK